MTSEALAGLLGDRTAPIEAVLHMAAIPVPRLGTPADIFDLNSAATFRLFQACADAGIPHLVVASSINAIGYYFSRLPFELDYLPVDEAHPKTTSDPYSFSKQITEEIAAYFARAAGITSRCLRFGAGLESIDQMQDGFGQRLRDARAQVEALSQAPAAAARAEVARMRHVYDEARRLGRSSDLPAAERSLMGLRHNLFSFIELGEACRAIRLALTTPAEGATSMFIVDQHNGLGLEAQHLANVMYPDVGVRGSLGGDQSLIRWEAAATMGFESQVSAQVLLD